MYNAPFAAAKNFQATSVNALSSALGPSPKLSPDQTLAQHSAGAARLVPVEYSDLDYRRAALASTVENFIAWQVRINREERGLTQKDLAALMGTGQSAISKLEDPEGGDVQVSTLLRAAHAFDCALILRFVDFASFVEASQHVQPERLFAPSFVEAQQPSHGPRKRVRALSNGNLQSQTAGR